MEANLLQVGRNLSWKYIFSKKKHHSKIFSSKKMPSRKFSFLKENVFKNQKSSRGQHKIRSRAACGPRAVRLTPLQYAGGKEEILFFWLVQAKSMDILILIDGIGILKDLAIFPSVNIEWLSMCYIYCFGLYRPSWSAPIVFGHQASIEMQEMALTVKFRGHLGGKLIFVYLV